MHLVALTKGVDAHKFLSWTSLCARVCAKSQIWTDLLRRAGPTPSGLCNADESEIQAGNILHPLQGKKSLFVLLWLNWDRFCWKNLLRGSLWPQARSEEPVQFSEHWVEIHDSSTTLPFTCRSSIGSVPDRWCDRRHGRAEGSICFGRLRRMEAMFVL